MNQIIAPINKLNEDNNFKKHISLYKKIFIFSILIILVCIIIYLFTIYNSYKKQKLSKNLINNFSITTLYNNSINSVDKKTSTLENKSNIFIIGLIQIDKINLLYPIFSETSEELLKISPCKCAGPFPNEIGNLCIAGHNYANNTIFGKLNYLEIGDTIKIYDSTGNNIEYQIYTKQEVSATDTSCLRQNTNGKREVTLITCNTLKGTRVVFKCSEI